MHRQQAEVEHEKGKLENAAEENQALRRKLRNMSMALAPGMLPPLDVAR